MSPDGQHYVTKDGLEKLKVELKHLKSVKRKEIAQRIQEAKELGDLSENAEYSEAKNEQAFIEGRIIELENILKNAEVIEEGATGGVVRIGSTVRAKSDTAEVTYTIVGSNEASPVKGLISNESPIGEAFLGHKVGDTVEVQAPAGIIKYKVVEVK